MSACERVCVHTGTHSYTGDCGIRKNSESKF